MTKSTACYRAPRRRAWQCPAGMATDRQRTTPHASDSSGPQRPDLVLPVVDRDEGVVEEGTVVAMFYRDFPIDVRRVSRAVA